MNRLRHIFIWAMLIAVLSGCTAFKLRDANQMLVDLYTAKVELDSRPDSDENFLMRSNINEGLFQLAEDAAAEAGKAKTQKLTQIAFYRIAATATWQAMNAATDDTRRREAKQQLLSYAAQGQKKCDTPDEAPRDCGMLLVIPTLAGIDEHRAQFEEIKGRVDRQEEVTAGELLAVFDVEAAALSDLIRKYGMVADDQVHPRFLAHLEDVMTEAYCDRVDHAVDLIKTQLGKKDPAYADARKRGQALKEKLEATLKGRCSSPCGQ